MSLKPKITFLNLLMFELDFVLGNKCSIDHKIKQNSTQF